MPKANQPIYMDYQSTTPVDDRVLEVMLPYFSEKFGNPHSREHSFGWEAEAAVDIAREQVADLIGAEPTEIIFTSGATESNNLAIKGLAASQPKDKKHIITVRTEHKCVLESCHYLEKNGFDVTYLEVDKYGLIDLDGLERAINESTFLVSVMAVNNEIGVIQPIKEIGDICRQRGLIFHTDAAQAFGKIALDVNDMNINMMSISGHKIYAPKGIGALYIKRRPRVRLQPIIHGGGQEKGLRSGTLPTPLIAGFGKAAEIAPKTMDAEYKKYQEYFDRFINEVVEPNKNITVNGSLTARIPHNINLSFKNIAANSMILSLKNVAISSGSACSSASIEPSHVLQAIGVDKNLSSSTIRFGFGRYTKDSDIDIVIGKIKDALK